MKHAELNKVGDFDCWNQNRLVELLCLKSNEMIDDDYLIYQGEGIKLSVFIMAPKERIPFRKFKNDFNLICLSGGSVLSRSSNGGINLLVFEEGEYVTYNPLNSTMISDFQNVGEEILVMAFLEYDHAFETEEIPLRFLDWRQPQFSKN